MGLINQISLRDCLRLLSDANVGYEVIKNSAGWKFNFTVCTEIRRDFYFAATRLTKFQRFSHTRDGMVFIIFIAVLYF